MTPPDGQSILTAAGMRAAADAAIAASATVESLMDRAGHEIARAVRRLAGANAILIVCGPGNNGGDGYVAARLLKEGGLKVRVAALGEPKTPAATSARAEWIGPVEHFAEAEPAPILIDALFGTGLSGTLDRRSVKPGAPQNHPSFRRRLGSQAANGGHGPHETPPFAGVTVAGGDDNAVSIAAKIGALVQAAHLSIAIDLPSGVTTDEGKVLGDIAQFDLTLALGALKPSHLLQPAARHCGTVRILDIGVAVSSDVHVLSRPNLPDPGPDSHKYTRGMVAVIGGVMPGAARLASIAALRAGAGYVLLLTEMPGGADAVVHKPFSAAAITDKRIGALLIGPGLGRNADAEAKLNAALATDRALVIDGDALHLLKGERFARLSKRETPVILTPHAGEFDALFGASHASKIARTRAAARQANAIVVHKGPDTVIADPDGRVRVARNASNWLSTAGTGDVLAGAIAAALATGMEPFEAAAAGVWLHADAARRIGGAFIADDLAQALTVARANL